MTIARTPAPERRRLLGTLALRRAGLSEGAREKLLYAGAAASYITVCVFVTELALSWLVGFAWLLLWVTGLPALVRRLRT